MDDINQEKEPDEIYCSECGRSIRRNAIFCDHCGKKIIIDKKQYQERPEAKVIYTDPKNPKSKAVAITLAVIFSYWSWLYTFKKDKIKFWVFFGIIMFFTLIYIMVSCSNIAASIVDPNYNIYAMADTYRGFMIIIGFVNFISWCWALSDSIRSPLSFYLNYPNENRFENQIKTPLRKI